MWHISKIPQIAHFYWGNSIMPWLRYTTIKSFSICNPEWKIKLYTPTSHFSGGKMWEQKIAAQKENYRKDYMEEVKNLPNTEIITVDFNKMGVGDIPEVFRSDLIRLQALGTEGGLWSDMDVTYFRPMDEVYFNEPRNADVDTCICYTYERRHYSIGFMLGSVNNSFYKFLYDQGLSRLLANGDRQTFGVILWGTFFPKPESIKERFPHLNIHNIEMDVVYPYKYYENDQIFNQNLPIKSEKTIGCHYFGGHPFASQWEVRLTEENFCQFDTTIVRCLKRVFKK